MRFPATFFGSGGGGIVAGLHRSGWLMPNEGIVFGIHLAFSFGALTKRMESTKQINERMISANARYRLGPNSVNVRTHPSAK